MGESLKELLFLLFIPYFFVPLTFGRRYFRSKMKRKTSFPFAFRSLIRIFDLWSKLLLFGNEKKNMFSFCISLTYSYLCTVKT